MSGQCLSPSEPGHALTPGTHHSLGRPLPHQQANRTWTHPQTESHLWSGDVIWYYRQFPTAIPGPRVDIHALLSLSPLEYSRRSLSARLACLIHAANVHSEPGSNPSIVYAFNRLPTNATSQSESKSIDGLKPSKRPASRQSVKP